MNFFDEIIDAVVDVVEEPITLVKGIGRDCGDLLDDLFGDEGDD